MWSDGKWCEVLKNIVCSELSQQCMWDIGTNLDERDILWCTLRMLTIGQESA